MLFDKNTFIVPVTSTDTKVFLKSADGVVVFIIDPTNVVNIFTAANSIRIKTKSDLHVLDFNTNINAIAALPLLKAALDAVVISSTTIIGGGTFNYVTKFTPDGISVGNSILYDTGSRLGIGTITPSGLLHIKSSAGTTFRAETSTGALFNINDNNTVTYTGFNVSFTGANTSSNNLLITGTSGLGYISLPNQSLNVSITGSDTKLFSDINGNLSFFNHGFVKTFDSSSNTALRTYYLQNKTGTVAHLDDIFGTPGTSELAPVISTLNNPPVSPVTGDRYLVDVAPTGSWLTFEKQIAEWNGLAWVFTSPALNNVLYITNVLMTLRYNGSAWILYQGTAILQNGNSLGGSLNIGTNDNNALTFKTNNIQRLTISPTGNIGIGTNTPTSTLHVAGTFKYVDGNQSLGYILTSDVNGNATWQAPTSIITKYSAMSVAITANLTLPIVHNIGNTAITINVWDTLTGDMILGFDANNRTINSVDITLSVTGNYDIVIIG